MKSEIQNLLRLSKSSAELVKAVQGLCASIGRVEAVTVSCGGGSPHRLVCMIRMRDEGEASELSTRLGVVAGGTADVIFSYELPADFRCLQDLVKSSTSCLCFPVVEFRRSA